MTKPMLIAALSCALLASCAQGTLVSRCENSLFYDGCVGGSSIRQNEREVASLGARSLERAARGGGTVDRGRPNGNGAAAGGGAGGSGVGAGSSAGGNGDTGGAAGLGGGGTSGAGSDAAATEGPTTGSGGSDGSAGASGPSDGSAGGSQCTPTDRPTASGKGKSRKS